MLALLAAMFVPVLKTAAMLVPGAGLAFGAALEQTKWEQFDYVTPLDLGSEPYFEEE